MKLGMSTYCLDGVIKRGEKTLSDVIHWAAAQGATCVELVPFAYSFLLKDGRLDEKKIESAKEAAASAGVTLCNYSVLANFCLPAGEAFEAEVARVKRHVDVAAALGIPTMRHDVSAFRRERGQNSSADYEEQLPRITEAALRVTEYAAGVGVRTLVENHGFFVNGCDRIERMLHAVSHDNFGLLLDTGNIICVDEDPAVATKRLAGLAVNIHLKDFYVRKRDPGDTTEFDCAGNWFRSMGGRFLRGAILAQGDLDMWEILTIIKHSGFDGPIALEFEGMEEAVYATRVSLMNARRIWEEV